MTYPLQIACECGARPLGDSLGSYAMTSAHFAAFAARIRAETFAEAIDLCLELAVPAKAGQERETDQLKRACRECLIIGYEGSADTIKKYAAIRAQEGGSNG